MAPKPSPQSVPFAQLLVDKFGANVANEDLSILQSLKRLHRGENTRHVALLDSTTCPSFPLSAYLHARGVSVDVASDPKHELVRWDPSFGAGSAAGLQVLEDFGPGFVDDQGANKGRLVPRLITGCMQFLYEGTEFLVYKVSYYKQHGQVALIDIIFEEASNDKREGDSRILTAGHKLASDVYRWAMALKDEMWVFQDGYWAKDKALWSAIRDATWDSIVLEDEFLEGLRRDTHTFFENRKIYKDLGVVWKRGLLLLGPPGNGKTETIKVLLKESGQAALYVKSFTTADGPELGVRRIFDHARANAPCILVIEDLDSLVISDVRSFFLNELDGIGQNEGILTIATTNHPERIDDAILNRPSRFDVKYNFALPTEKLRAAYALKWFRKIAALPTEAIVLFEKSEDQLAEDVAKETDGWSFAFLKELFVSFLLRIAHDKVRAVSGGKGASLPQSRSTDEVLMQQIKALSNQVIKDDKDDDNPAGSTRRNPMFTHNFVRALSGRPAIPIPAHLGINF